MIYQYLILAQPKDHEIKVLVFMCPPKYVILKSLNVSHWLSRVFLRGDKDLQPLP